MSCRFEPKARQGPLSKRCAACGEHKDIHRSDNDGRECSDRKQDLSHTNLQRLPDHLRTMHSLTTLILSNNQIAQLPAWICELHSLRELYLNNNKLVELPHSFGQLQLNRLSLGCNPLSATLKQAYDQCQPIRHYNGLIGIGRDPAPLLAWLRDYPPEPTSGPASHQHGSEAAGVLTDPLLEASLRIAFQAAGDSSTAALRDALAVYGLVPTTGAAAIDPYHEHVLTQQPTAQHSTAVCPITADVFSDPVVCQDGQTYERVAIERWLFSHDTSPMTNAVLPNTTLVPNLALRHQIEELAAAASCLPPAAAHAPTAATHQPPPACIKCVVLDFDQTISTKQVGMFDLSSQVADRCFGGGTRVQLLKQLFQELRDIGISIVILTRNSAHTVRKALAAVGLEVCEVIGNEKFDLDIPKSVSMTKGVLGPRGLEAGGVLFVDDEMANIRDVKERVCCACVHVDNVGQRVPGINSHHYDQIRSLCTGDYFHIPEDDGLSLVP